MDRQAPFWRSPPDLRGFRTGWRSGGSAGKLSGVSGGVSSTEENLLRVLLNNKCIVCVIGEVREKVRTHDTKHLYLGASQRKLPLPCT